MIKKTIHKYLFFFIIMCIFTYIFTPSKLTGKGMFPLVLQWNRYSLPKYSTILLFIQTVVTK